MTCDFFCNIRAYFPKNSGSFYLPKRLSSYACFVYWAPLSVGTLSGSRENVYGKHCFSPANVFTRALFDFSRDKSRISRGSSCSLKALLLLLQSRLPRRRQSRRTIQWRARCKRWAASSTKWRRPRSCRLSCKHMDWDRASKVRTASRSSSCRG